MVWLISIANQKIDHQRPPAQNSKQLNQKQTEQNLFKTNSKSNAYDVNATAWIKLSKMLQVTRSTFSLSTSFPRSWVQKLQPCSWIISVSGINGIKWTFVSPFSVALDHAAQYNPRCFTTEILKRFSCVTFHIHWELKTVNYLSPSGSCKSLQSLAACS